MFSPAGNLAVERLIMRLKKRGNELDDPEKLKAAARAGMAMIEAKHGEVWDAEPRWHIFIEAVRPIAKLHGFEDKVSQYL